MKLFCFLKDGNPRVGMEVDGGHYDIEQVILSSQECKTVNPLTKILNYLNFDDIIGLIGAGIKSENALRTVASYIAWNKSHGDPLLLRSSALEECSLNWLPSIPQPPVLYGIGGNSPLFFRDKNYQIPAYPRGFVRPNSKNAIIGHNGTVHIPKHYSTMRASAELGVVISRAGKNISETEAMDYVYGYTLVNDMCSDSWKIVALDGIDEAMMLTDLTVFTKRAATSYYSRSTDTFTAVGPYLVTKDEVPDPYNLMVWNSLSGVVREKGYTQSMVNGIERTISFLSRIFTLQPGMIFHMGTMGIDGYTVEQDMRLDGTDYFEIEYERIGKLRNYICDEREHD